MTDGTRGSAAYDPGAVRIRSPHPPMEARQRLERSLQQVHWATLFGTTGLAGWVREDRVRLMYHHPMFRNSFKPVLTATLHADGAGSLLTGRFHLHPLVVAFMACWFGFGGLMLLLSLATMGIGRAVGIDAAMLLFGIMLVWIGRRLSRSDPARIVDAVCRALEGATEPAPPRQR